MAFNPRFAVRAFGVAASVLFLALRLGANGVMPGLASDAEVRRDGAGDGSGTLANATAGSLHIGNPNSGTATATASPVFVFQLPDLGAVANPFSGATFSVGLVTSSSTFNGFNADVYGLPARSAATVLGDDAFAGGNDTTGATRLADNWIAFNTGSTVATGVRTLSNSALTAYLNAEYAGGAGAGRHVFIRLSPDAIGSTFKNIRFASAENSDATTRPSIAYTLAGPPPPNVAPVLPAQADRSASATLPFTVVNTATDANLPAQTLTYRLVQAPPGMTISANGVISWTPGLEQVGAVFTVETEVTDSGTPPLSATNTFTVTVTPAGAYDLLLDFETPGQFDAHFTRTLFDSDDFLGFASQTTSAGNGVVAYDDRTFGIFFEFPSWSIFTFNNSPGTPGWPRVSNRSTFLLTAPLRVSADLKVPASAAGFVFAVEFSDPNDAEKTRTVRAQITVNNTTQSIDFRRVTAIPGEGTVSLGSPTARATALQPGAASFTRVNVVLDVSSSPRTLTLEVAGSAPVVHILADDLVTWPQTLVSLGFFDPDIERTVNGVFFSGIGPTLLDNFSIGAGAGPIPPPVVSASLPVIPTTPVPPAGVNLLAVNPGFEDSAAQTFTGAWTLPGWTGNNPDTDRLHRVQTSGSPGGGERRFTMDRRGTLATATTARAAVAPGHRYELAFDLRTFNRTATVKLGTFVNLNFFDVSGNLLKTVWGPDWRPWLQSEGEHPWTTYRIVGIAPPGAVSAGVSVETRGGPDQFGGTNGDGRSIDVDNFRLTRLSEARDLIAVRRAPRLIEPGRTARLRIHTAAPAHRELSVRLLSTLGAAVANGGFTVPAGRGLHTVEVAVPAGLPDGDYRWEIRLLPQGGGAAVATRTLDPVPSDTAVKTSTINTTDFAADDPYVVYQGRVEDLSGGRRKLHWYGSEVRVRFSGTSLTLLGSSENNGFGGANPGYVYVVINDNEAGATPLRMESLNESGSAVFRIISGLPEGIHTARIFKTDESVDSILRIDRFRVDAGRGLLRPEPAPTRKIEIYGDSVSSGSTTLPTWLGYGPRLARELDAEVRIISKGGSGLGGAFGVELITRFWDNLKFYNAFNASLGTKWDFTRWQPDLVMIAAGHNDLFRAPSVFPQRYAEFVASLRGVYGASTPIFATNTTISAPDSFFDGALSPLLATDPNLHWSFQRYTTPGSRGHPNNLAHGWMTHGDVRQFSYAEQIEAIMGWGLEGLEFTGYDLWAAARFDAAQRAAGLDAPGADPDGQGVPNLLRYALGANDTAPASAVLPTGQVDAEGRLTLSFFRASEDVVYRVEVSDDLATWTVAATNPGTVGATHTWVDTAPAGARRFARLRVELP